METKKTKLTISGKPRKNLYDKQGLTNNKNKQKFVTGKKFSKPFNKSNPGSSKFPKNLIKKLPKGDKFALAGSISKDNVENISKLGINFFDLSSSLESQLGYKDHQKIKQFMSKINGL